MQASALHSLSASLSCLRPLLKPYYHIIRWSWRRSPPLIRRRSSRRGRSLSSVINISSFFVLADHHGVNRRVLILVWEGGLRAQSLSQRLVSVCFESAVEASEWRYEMSKRIEENSEEQRIICIYYFCHLTGSDKDTRNILPNGFLKFVIHNAKELEMLLMHNKWVSVYKWIAAELPRHDMLFNYSDHLELTVRRNIWRRESHLQHDASSACCHVSSRVNLVDRLNDKTLTSYISKIWTTLALKTIILIKW